MKMSGISDQHEPMWEINITPLTDVFLVLLIIFMVTTPLIMTSGIKIKMPRTKALPALTERDVIIAVTADEKYYVNNTEVPRARLMGWLEEMDLKDKFVVVQADKTVQHGVVVEALDIAKQAGAEKLAIATEPARERAK